MSSGGSAGDRETSTYTVDRQAAALWSIKRRSCCDVQTDEVQTAWWIANRTISGSSAESSYK
jgi:hypothetical protein